MDIHECNKMVLAILQGDDYEDTVRTLNEKDFYVTVLHTSGGFLKRRSVTLMMALPEHRLDDALEILKSCAGERATDEFVSPILVGHSSIFPAVVPVSVRCGGGIVFVFDVQAMWY